MRDNIRRPLAGRRLASGLCQAGIREARKAGNLPPCRATDSDPARQGVEAIAELLTSRGNRVPPHTHDSNPQDPNFAMLKPNILPVLGSEPLPTPKASAGTTSDQALHRNKIAYRAIPDPQPINPKTITLQPRRLCHRTAAGLTKVREVRTVCPAEPGDREFGTAVAAFVTAGVVREVEKSRANSAAINPPHRQNTGRVASSGEGI